MKFVVLAGVLLALIAAFLYFGTTDTIEEMADVDMVAEDTTEPTVAEEEEEVAEEETAGDDESAETDGESAQVREFDIESFMYGYSPNSITVTQGDTVTINLTNSEGLHDWVIDEFAAATEIIGAGEETSITFVADQVGEFEFYCSVGNHRAQGMVGTLVVE